jgi:hypothetical protein
MFGRRIWWMWGLCVWAVLGSAACSYLDEDLALTDEEFEESLAAESQIYDMGEMTIGGIGLSGFGYGCGGGGWGHRLHKRRRVRISGASAIIVDEEPAAAQADQAITLEQERAAWLAFEAVGQDDAEPTAPTALDRAFAGAGAHFVEVELARREDTAGALARAGALR